MSNKKTVVIILSSIILISLGTFVTYSVVEYILAHREKPTLPDGDYTDKNKTTNNDFDQIAFDLENKYHNMFYQLDDYGEVTFNKIVRKAVGLGFKYYNMEKIYATSYNPPRYLLYYHYHKYEKPYTIFLEIEFDLSDNFVSSSITVEKDLQSQISKENNNNQLKQSDSNSNSVIKGLYPQTSTYKMNASEFYGLTKQQLKIMRNEIFARHGYIFKTDDMKNYFARQTWYVPRYSNVDSDLTEIEKYNIEMIKRFE